MCPGDQSRPPKCDVKLTPTALPISSATAVEITVFADQGSETQSNFRLHFFILISKVAGRSKAIIPIFGQNSLLAFGPASIPMLPHAHISTPPHSPPPPPP